MGENRPPEDSAKLIVEHRREMMIFWAVLVLTCVVGIIELLPEIGQPFNVQQGCLFIIYFVLLLGMCFSIWRVFAIYRQIRSLALSGELGTKVQETAKNELTFFDKIMDWSRCRYFEILLIALAIIVFGLLYFAKILGW
jgi:hypothetical protein